MIDLSKFNGIIFDMDGTLVDSMGAHIRAWEITCEAFGYPFDSEYHYSLGGVPTVNTVGLLNEKHGKNNDTAEVTRFKKAQYERLAQTPELIEDTYSVFQHYLGKLPMSVGTGSDRAHADHVLRHHGLHQQLDAIVTADDVSKGKPHPETFLKAAALMGVPANECVVFEDTNIGLEAAERAGMQCIMVINGKVQPA